MWLFLEVIDTWFKLCRLFFRLTFLQPFVQVLKELKYFAFDALFYPECFQSSRNDPQFFQNTELAVLDNQYCFVVNNRMLLKECKLLVRNMLGNFYLFLLPVINFGVYCVVPSKRGEAPSLCTPVVLLAFDKIQKSLTSSS